MALSQPMLKALAKKFHGLSPAEAAKFSYIHRLKTQPQLLMQSAGMTPDPWQLKALTSKSKRKLFLCSRRAGKTAVDATLALSPCLVKADQTALVFSPTERQSMEVLREVKKLLNAAGKPVAIARWSLSEIELANGSRIVSLPDSPQGVVGFTPNILIIDEAARCSDELYLSLRPMLALNNPDLILSSTAYGKRGFYFEIWDKPERLANWDSYLVTVDECPRIGLEHELGRAAFLREERAELGERWYAQEYYCNFNDTVGGAFSPRDISAAVTDDVKPLFE